MLRQLGLDALELRPQQVRIKGVAALEPVVGSGKQALQVVAYARELLDFEFGLEPARAIAGAHAEARKDLVDQLADLADEPLEA